MKTRNLRIDPEFQTLLRGIQIRFARFFDLVLQGKKVTVSQYNVLATLSSEGPLAMNRVAKKLHITKPAITHLVDCLENEKLISRDSHPKDRRVFLLNLTNKGKILVRNVQRRFIKFATVALSRVSMRERKIIKRFYQILTIQLDKVLSS